MEAKRKNNSLATQLANGLSENLNFIIDIYRLIKISLLTLI